MILILTMIPIVLSYSKKNINMISDRSKYIIISLSLILAVVSYYWVPTSDYDLYRYREFVNNYTFFGLKDTISYMFSRGEYITMLYFYIMSFVSDRAIIQVLPVFLIYLFLFTYLFNLSNTAYKKTRSIFGVGLMIYYFSRLHYIFIISSFRFWFGFILFMIIQNLIVKKRISRYWIIVPIFIHNSIAILLLIWILVNILNKKSKYVIVGFYGMALAAAYFLTIKFGTGYLGEGVFLTYISKLISYFTPSIIWDNQFIVQIFEIFILLLFYYFSTLVNESKRDDIIKEFTFSMLLFTILSITNRVLFARMLEVSRLLMIPIIYKYMQVKLEDYQCYSTDNKSFIISMFLVISLLVITISGMYIQYRILIIDILPNLIL